MLKKRLAALLLAALMLLSLTACTQTNEDGSAEKSGESSNQAASGETSATPLSGRFFGESAARLQTSCAASARRSG